MKICIVYIVNMLYFVEKYQCDSLIQMIPTIIFYFFRRIIDVFHLS